MSALSNAPVEGYLPGLVPSRKWLQRLLDVYDLAHLQLVHGVDLTAEVYARVHPIASAKATRTPFANYWTLLERLVEFGAAIGIEVTRSQERVTHRLHFRFTDPAAAVARCNEILDTIALSTKGQDDESDELAGQPDVTQTTLARRQSA